MINRLAQNNPNGIKGGFFLRNFWTAYAVGPLKQKWTYKNLQIAEAVKIQLTQSAYPKKGNPATSSEVSRVVLGIHDVYGYIYDLINFTIVLCRIAYPCSKLGCNFAINQRKTDGLPVGHELFPGAVYEGHTLNHPRKTKSALPNR